MPNRKMPARTATVQLKFRCLRLSQYAMVMSAALTAFAGSAPAYAQPADTRADHTVEAPVRFVTKHSGRFNGTGISYTAIAGETHLRNEDGEPRASIFTVSYIRKDIKSPSTRPVIFIFNGGPGSSVVWLHVGQFGPVRVHVPDDASDDGAAPYRLVHNHHSVLDVADLVMIDPVGTGYSRAIGQGKNQDYWGHNEDARSIGEFIRIWLTENGRWNSPKYLAGESFGTVRAALVADAMGWGAHDVAFNGIILMSQILDYAPAQDIEGNFLANVYNLPAMATAARYHGMTTTQLDASAFAAEAKRFAENEYLPALLAGRDLDPARRTHILDELQRFTGLSRDYLDKSDLKVTSSRFAKELLRRSGLSVGQFDSRYTGADHDQIATTSDEDASAYGNGSAYTAAMNEVLGQFLKVRMDRPYKTLNMEPYLRWNWRTSGPDDYYEPSFSNVTPQLGRAMQRTPGLKILVACGLYDLVTTCASAEHVFARSIIPAGRTRIEYYDAGHMMYMHDPSSEKLSSDIRRFILETRNGGR